MADNAISINAERFLKPVKEQFDAIYKENLLKHKKKKIERYESEGRLSDLSDDEYTLYLSKKKEEGKKYFWHIDDKDFNRIIIGKFCKNVRGDSDGRLFYFSRDGRYKGKQATSHAGQYYQYRAEIISEEELIKVCKSHLKLDEKDVNYIINLIPKDICDFEDKIPEKEFIELIIWGACGEDINLEDLLH